VRLPAGLQAAIRRAVEAWPPSEKKVSVSYLLNVSFKLPAWMV